MTPDAAPPLSIEQLVTYCRNEVVPMGRHLGVGGKALEQLLDHIVTLTADKAAMVEATRFLGHKCGDLALELGKERARATTAEANARTPGDGGGVRQAQVWKYMRR